MNTSQTINLTINNIFPDHIFLRKWDLSGGMSAQMTAFELLQPNGSTKKMILRTPSDLVLRNNPSVVKNEFSFLKFLKKK